MTYEKLDNEELLRVSLDAINQDRHADAVTMLKTLLEREPAHVFATYLLAAEHAQLGMMDRAEEGFVRTVELAPDFPMARFQLGQIYLVKGDGPAAKRLLAPLAKLPANLALACYARGLSAAVDEDVAEAMSQLRAGLACEQEIPALAQDMQCVLANLGAIGATERALSEPAGINPAAAAPMYLSNYGRPGE